MRFQGKVGIVTGGASGMGLATVRGLEQEGCRVYTLDIQASNSPRCLHCDVRDPAQVRAAVAQIREQEGQIDALFAAAGVHLFADVEHTSTEDLDRVLDVNVKGTFYILQEVLPVMRAQQGGRIVLMGSDQAFIGKPLSSAYGLSKAAIGQLTKSTAIDYAPYHIRINCICPGTIDTPFVAAAAEHLHQLSGEPVSAIYQQFRNAQPLKRLGRPEEVARLVLLLLCDELDFMTGALVSIDGGFTCQ